MSTAQNYENLGDWSVETDTIYKAVSAASSAEIVREAALLLDQFPAYMLTEVIKDLLTKPGKRRLTLEEIKGVVLVLELLPSLENALKSGSSKPFTDTPQ